MKEIQVTMYEAEDGRKFGTRVECEKYEKKLAWLPEAMDILERLKQLCADNNCGHCPYSDTDGGCLFERNLLPCNFDVDKIREGLF